MPVAVCNKFVKIYMLINNTNIKTLIQYIKRVGVDKT